MAVHELITCHVGIAHLMWPMHFLCCSQSPPTSILCFSCSIAKPCGSFLSRPHIIYVASMSHLSNVYVSSMPQHPLSRHQLGIALASSMHLLCIIHVSCRGHMSIVYATVTYSPSMCHLRTSSALSMYRLRTISASSIHRLCVIYAPDYTIYVPSIHHLNIINAST